MRIAICAGILAMLSGLSGCLGMAEPSAPRAAATLRDAAGVPAGTATVTVRDGRMLLSIEAQGLTGGPRGLHVHAVGKCEPPRFESAGPHWNPTSKQHGRDNPQGAHHGDLPNIEGDANGRGSVTAELAGTFAELMDEDGAAIIIHATADDYRTDPSGNSGGRVACGVFAPE